MKILFVINTFEYGGAEKHLLYLVRHLSASNVSCLILCYGPDFYSERLGDQNNVRVLQRSEPMKFWDYWTMFFRLRPSVIVFVKGWMDAFPLKAYLAAKLSGASRLFAIEQLIPFPAPPQVAQSYIRRIFGWRARYMWRVWLGSLVCRRTICVSLATRERLIEEYGVAKNRTVTIWNGVYPKHYGRSRNGRGIAREKLDITPDEHVLVCLSRFVAWKRIDVLLDAMALLSKSCPCKCIIVGDGPLREKWVTQSMSLALSSKVIFSGFQEDVRPYLEASDILVAPSEVEGLPLTLAEAMAFELPCVATNIGGHNEIVVHEHTGLLVTPGSAEELAKAIQYLLTHPDERKRMGSTGRKRVEECFDLEVLLEEFKTVFLK
jgi:glycosyltransferase involved in cell wall biosynthesis